MIIAVNQMYMTLQMLKVHPEGVIGVSNTAEMLAVVTVKGSVAELKGCVKRPEVLR